MYLLYSMLFSLGMLLIGPYYWWRKGRGLPRSYWRERLGDIPYHETRAGAIWVHAVSLGETLAVAGLVEAMQQAFPERKIYLSHVTPAGREAGEKRLPNIAGRFFVPLDWRWTVGRAMARIKPSLLVIVETELWPNLLRGAKQAGARVVVVNARMSRRSLRHYKAVRPIMRRVLENVDAIYGQTEEDVQRFLAIGAPPERVSMAGNLKFDAQPPRIAEFARALKNSLHSAQRGPILVAASTMPGEEPLVLEAWDKIQARHPRALMILAPRHPARFEEVNQLLTQTGRRFVRRTSLDTDQQALASSLTAVPILLLDTIGELAGIFELADLVFMGGSLVPKGGHNLLEPAYWSKATVFGPYMENFRDIARLFLDAGAAVQIRDSQGLAQAASSLLEDSAARQGLGERARQTLERHSGATARVIAGFRAIFASQGGVPIEVK